MDTIFDVLKFVSSQGNIIFIIIALAAVLSYVAKAVKDAFVTLKKVEISGTTFEFSGFSGNKNISTNIKDDIKRSAIFANINILDRYYEQTLAEIDFCLEPQ